jgi:hypothetical protein
MCFQRLSDVFGSARSNEREELGVALLAMKKVVGSRPIIRSRRVLRSVLRSELFDVMAT